MSVLVYMESDNGKFKKNAFEAASYAYKLAEQLSTSVTAITLNAPDSEVIGNYGVSKILKVASDKLSVFNAKAVATVIAQAVENEGAKIIVVSSSTDTKYMASILAGILKAGYCTNVVAPPLSTNPLVVKRMAFSNKGFVHTQFKTDINIIGVSSNAYGIFENKVSPKVENFEPNLDDSDFSVQSVNIDKVVGKATIADADIVVSGGRGLKGPENWGMIEELADVLGAATACSKPVSDMGWRSHSEHVGQTGKPVASNLYIAIGISGAIQHLAGVNASKVKVVINTDPEAPFFKAADYGIVGDAFEVVPKLIEKLKEFKAQNA
ncbi:MAG: electron transfer flavoprotein subunit alpha/FixB family protein [Eudoraea sp.]|uniref:electron transfer flavoprotein subunit alpha/FixB family protein n=1 Tax=Eudoraea sp. TaxID=1979955 RepID=UPI003C7390FE